MINAAMDLHCWAIVNDDQQQRNDRPTTYIMLSTDHRNDLVEEVTQ